ncbi:uncharacterized protein LOC111431919 [Cucurbita moschata]|uniref:Uncharacterized protein LOC111431919 n=1 Tax=Cucurbita moschata TaxID=3662 RepID=A0A6J1E8V3_CUCMO|nr:uncharacterized protein LOC111431919 [Cucurbita moschata]
MGRRQSDAERGVCALAIIFLMGISSCIMVFHFLIGAIRPSAVEVSSTSDLVKNEEHEECCRGTDHVELWGGAVKWGANFKFNSSRECCLACKAMCEDQRGRCLCDSWVFCGDSKICGSRFGECWLKKQKDIMNPERRESGGQVGWTSGLVFGRKQGIVRVETEYGSFRMKLFPDCAPHSVNFILELLALGCVGCQFHRAESRGSFWFSNGDHVENAPYGPPFALIQGTLEAHGIVFEENPKEYCPTIRRGSVAWVDSGPEFFISLANHDEWRKAHTVFGSVLPEDMEIVEKIAQLPTKSEVWQNVDVSVLEKPIPLQLKGMKTNL